MAAGVHGCLRITSTALLLTGMAAASVAWVAAAPPGKKKVPPPVVDPNPPLPLPPEKERPWIDKKERQLLTGHTNEVLDVAFSPDGQQVLSISSDSTVRLWDARSGVELLRLQSKAGTSAAVAFSPDGQRVAAGGWMAVLVWDLKTGKLLHTLDMGGLVRTLAWSRDGRWLLAGSAGKEVRLWEATPGRLARGYAVPPGTVRSLALLPDDRRTLVGTDKIVFLLDLRDGSRTPSTLRGASLVLARDGKHVFLGQRTSARLHDAATGKLLVNATHPNGYTLTSQALAPDGRRGLSGSFWGDIFLWDLTVTEKVGWVPPAGLAARLLHRLKGHSGTVNGIAFAPDGRRAVSGGRDRTVRIWDLETGTELANCGQADWEVFSPDHRWVLVWRRERRLIELWNVYSKKLVRTLEGHTKPVLRMVFSPRGQYAATLGADETLRIWEVATGRCLHRKAVAGPVPVNLFVTDSGEQVLAGGADGSVRGWDLAAGQEFGPVPGHKGPVRRMLVGAEGKEAFSAGEDGVVLRWDVASGKVLRRYEMKQGAITHLALAPDGKEFLIGTAARTLALLNTSTGKRARGVSPTRTWIEPTLGIWRGEGFIPVVHEVPVYYPGIGTTTTTTTTIRIRIITR